MVQADALGLDKYMETSCFENYSDSPNGFFTVYNRIFNEIGKLENKAQGMHAR